MTRRTENHRGHSATREAREDGWVQLRSNHALSPVPERTGDWLHRRADEAPQQILLAERGSASWEEEALAAARHKPNVYIGLFGWWPKKFLQILVRYCSSILKKKVLFGSDWPMITPDHWLADFAPIAIKDELRPNIVKGNAARLPGTS